MESKLMSGVLGAEVKVLELHPDTLAHRGQAVYRQSSAPKQRRFIHVQGKIPLGTQISSSQHSRYTQVLERRLWEAKAQNIWQAQKPLQGYLQGQDKLTNKHRPTGQINVSSRAWGSCQESGRNPSILPRTLGTC